MCFYSKSRLSKQSATETADETSAYMKEKNIYDINFKDIELLATAGRLRPRDGML